MTFVDTHCHLHYSPLCDNVDAVINRARQANVQTMVCISTDMQDHEKIGRFIERDGIYQSIGVHPLSVERHDLLAIRSYLESTRPTKLVAIGETGLDNFRTPMTQAQIDSFEEHIRVAEALDLPIVMHSRGDVEELVMEVLGKTHVRGIAHCFGGSMRLAEFLVERGWHISFACNLTYKKNLDLHEIARTIPLEKLLIETDAPFLSPESMRQSPNEPANVVYAARKIADLKGLPVEVVATQTTLNAQEVFRFT